MSNELEPDIERLWVDYKEHGHREQRDQLIVHYSPLVKYVAGRAAPRRMRHRSNDLLGRLVLALPLIRHLPQKIVLGPCQVRNGGCLSVKLFGCCVGATDSCLH